MMPDIQQWLPKARPQRVTQFTRSLKPEERDRWPDHFNVHAHPGQIPPTGDWRVWLVMAGRGFGKTRAGRRMGARVAEADPARADRAGRRLAGRGAQR